MSLCIVTITVTLWCLTLLAFAGHHLATSSTDYKYFFDYIQGNQSHSSSGSVTSPGFPFSFPTSRSHLYFYELQHFDPGGRIKLDFTDFFLDAVNKSINMCTEEQNYFKIIDDRMSSRYCTFKRPAPHLSSTHTLRLEYHLHGNQRYHGYGVFRLDYAFITLEEAEEFERRLRLGRYGMTRVWVIGDSVVFWANQHAAQGTSKSHMIWAGVRGAKLSQLIPMIHQHLKKEPVPSVILIHLVQHTAYVLSNIGQVSVNILRHNTHHVDYLWYHRAKPGNRLLLNVLAVDINPLGTLQIRDGPTSQSSLLLLVHGNSTMFKDVLSSQENVYVHWHGEVNRYDTLRYLYSNVAPADSTGNCPSAYLKCSNGVCISKERQCDGVNNCPKGSDEEQSACQDQDSADCTCENGGTCMVRDNYLICLCPDDFTGERCQYIGRRKHVSAVISRCSCKNGGTCTPTSSGFGFVCNCLPGYGDYDCSQNNSLANGGASSTEYGIAMGAAVVAVLLVLFGVGLCLCVILQYLKQQREGPDGQYRPALSRDVYSVEAVNIGLNSVEPNDYIPPSYYQCTHHSSRTSMATPDGSMDGTLTPSNPGYQRRICRQQRTPESPPPNYDTILKLARDLSPFYRMFTSKGSLNFSEATRSQPPSVRDQDSVPNTGSLNSPSTPCNECFEMKNLPNVKEDK